MRPDSRQAAPDRRGPMKFYDLLLRLYPASFRNEYAGEMRPLFAHRWRAAHGAATIGLWLSTIGEVLFNAGGAHVDILKHDLWYIDAAPQTHSRIRDHRPADRRARNRRHHRRLFGDGLRPPPAVAVSSTRPVGENLGDDAGLRPDGVLLAQLSRLDRRGDIVQLDRDFLRGRHHDARHGRAAAVSRRRREHRSLRDARRVAARRPNVQRRREP